jgi:hypothetical protein
MKSKRTRFIAWGLAGVVVVNSVVNVALWVGRMNGLPTFYDLTEVLGWGLVLPLFFSILSALIISRQSGNRLGWLMMVVALALNNPVTYFLQPAQDPPVTVTASMWFLIWVNTWSWVPVIFPIFLIPLYFPTGHISSPRWRWVVKSITTLAVLFMLVAAFEQNIGQEMDWTLSNPIGFIPTDFIEGPFFIFWGSALIASIVASVVSLFLRYRKTSTSERQQIKWLLLAGAGFAIIYGLTFVFTDASAWVTDGWVNLALVLSVLGFPAAIAIAIFRYRLWDLGVVINRALIYGPLTTLLAGTFAMVIALTSELTKQALGDQSKALGAAISAVFVAVVFQPLRDRIESFVDKHFYPQKLDLVSGLVEVAPEYWGFLKQRTLIRLTLEHVRRVLRTAQVGFYLASAPGQFQLAGQEAARENGHPSISLSPKQKEELLKKRVVASESSGLIAGYVPLFIDRGDAIELLGLLSVGKRTDGKGYSGDDLKGLVSLGNKIGLALNAIQLAQEDDRIEARYRVVNPGMASG